MSDTNIRIQELPAWHAERGIAYQAAGMSDSYLAVICRGEQPAAIVNYVRRDMPVGDGINSADGRAAAAFAALGGLTNSFGDVLPFFTARYDWSNYAAEVIGHNPAARHAIAEVLGGYDDGWGWVQLSEAEFKAVLHRCQNVPLDGIVMHEGIYRTPWREAKFGREADAAAVMRAELIELAGRGRLKHPQQPISNRMAAYGRGLRNPASADRGLPQFDLDLAVTNRATRRLTMLVEYKSANSEFTSYVGADGRMRVKSTNGSNHDYSAHRLVNVRTISEGDRYDEVPAFIARYRDLGDEGEPITLYPLNRAAWSHLAFCLGHYGNEVEQTHTLATAVEGRRPVHVSAAMWEQIILDAQGR